MEWIVNIVGILIPAQLIVAAMVWWLNEYSKRKDEKRKRMEDRYMALLGSMRGFYEGGDAKDSKQQRDEFIRQMDLAWLYCPDEYIRKSYRFLTMAAGDKDALINKDQKQAALSDVVAQMRKDLFRKTDLKASEHLHIKSTPLS